MRSPYLAWLTLLWLTAITSRSVATTSAWNVPRTPWGDPDIQGVFTTNDVARVPVERPAEFGTRKELTAEEFAKKQADQRAREQQPAVPRAGQTGAGPDHWYEWFGAGSHLTSLVVDPPNGRFPPLTPEGQRRRAQARRGQGPRSESNSNESLESWEDLDLWERCITRGLPSGMIPTAYDNGYQILQTPGYVTILYENTHQYRVIPLDGRPHVGENIRQWLGDSRGHWEHDTLVVDVRNFNDKSDGTLKPNGGSASVGPGAYRGASGALHLIERFTRVDASTVEYQATGDDPNTWVAPWTIAIPLKQETGYRIFEDACHEGNYGLPNILRGARVTEAK